MQGLRYAVATLAITLFAGACGTADTGPRSAPVPVTDQTVVRVTNNNWSDVRVYLVYGTQRIRLGTVTSMQAAVLRVPQTYTSTSRSVRLLIDPIAQRETYLSEPITLGPGQHVDFRVQNHLAISSYSIR
jgi:hypothetical protein